MQNISEVTITVFLWKDEEGKEGLKAAEGQ